MCTFAYSELNNYQFECNFITYSDQTKREDGFSCTKRYFPIALVVFIERIENRDAIAYAIYSNGRRSLLSFDCSSVFK